MATAPPRVSSQSSSTMDEMKTLSRTKSLNKLSQPRVAPIRSSETHNTTIQVPNRMASVNETSRPKPLQPQQQQPGTQSTNQMLTRMKSLNAHSSSRPKTDSQSQTHVRMRSNTTSASTSVTPNFSRPDPTSPSLPQKGRYFMLKGRAQAFCTAFLNPANHPPEKILEDHFIPSDARIIEHGPVFAQAKLPYIARPFRGKNEGLWYFRLQSETVVFLPDANTFSGSESVVVDPDVLVPGQVGRGVATIMGKAKYKAVKSGQQWEARFVWRLSGFDEEGRIGLWEVWGDALSAWQAVGTGGGTPF